VWVTAVVVCGDELRAGDTMRRRPSADAHCVCDNITRITD